MTKTLLLDCGSGGRASQRLINELFLEQFDNPILRTLDDAAKLELSGPIAMSTDGYTVTPLFFPVAMALNIDPVHFGAIMIVNLAIGLVTPPVGVNLYVACGIADVSLKKISSSVVPLIIASLIVLLIVTYFEPLSLLLLGGSAA